MTVYTLWVVAIHLLLVFGRTWRSTADGPESAQILFPKRCSPVLLVAADARPLKVESWTKVGFVYYVDDMFIHVKRLVIADTLLVLVDRPKPCNSVE